MNVCHFGLISLLYIGIVNPASGFVKKNICRELFYVSINSDVGSFECGLFFVYYLFNNGNIRMVQSNFESDAEMMEILNVCKYRQRRGVLFSCISNFKI